MSSHDFWEQRYLAAATERVSLWGEAPNAWVAEQVELAGLQPGVALDLGAGEGRNSRWLAERGWRVTAVDFSAAAVAGMRAEADRLGLDVEAVEADATKWSENRGARPAAQLAVLCYLQLEPAALAAALAAAAASLAPGGLLLGIWHDREDVARGLGGSMTPTIRTTPAETAAAALAAGLEVRLSGGRDRPTVAGLARDALLVAVRPSPPVA